MPTVGVRSGGQSEVVHAVLTVASGAIYISFRLCPGAVTRAMEETGTYDWTLYGDDGVSAMVVVGNPLERSGPWPSDGHVRIRQRVDVSDPQVSGPTTVRVLGGL